MSASIEPVCNVPQWTVHIRSHNGEALTYDVSDKYMADYSVAEWLTAGVCAWVEPKKDEAL